MTGTVEVSLGEIVIPIVVACAILIAGVVVGIWAVITIQRFHLNERNIAESRAVLQGVASGGGRAVVAHDDMPAFFQPVERLQAVGINLPLGAWWLVRFLIMVVAVIVLFFFSRNVLVAFLFGGIGGFLVPIVVINRKASKRKKKFSLQLAEALPMIAENMRAGLTIEAAITSVTKFMGDPFRTEFGMLCQELAINNDLPRCMESCAARLDDKDLRQLAAIVTIVRESGGNLADLLDIEADHLNARTSMRNHIRAITSQGKLQSIVLSMLPVLILLVMSIFASDPYAKFWFSGELVPLLLMGLCVLMDALGFFVMSRFYNIPIA